MDGGQYNYFPFGIRKIVKGKKTMQIFQICTTKKWRNYKTVWFFSRWINKAGAYKLVASAAGDSKKDCVVTNCALRKQQRSDLSLSHSLACLGNHVWPLKPPYITEHYRIDGLRRAHNWPPWCRQTNLPDSDVRFRSLGAGNWRRIIQRMRDIYIIYMCKYIIHICM